MDQVAATYKLMIVTQRVSESVINDIFAQGAEVDN